MFPFGSTVTIIRSPGRDAYGDPIDGEPERIALTGVAVAPRVGGPGTASSDVTSRGREALVEGLTLYIADVGADIRRTDRVEIDGKTYDIDGEPSRWTNPLTGWHGGVEVAVRRTEG